MTSIDSLFAKKQNLATLIDHKIDLIHSLINIENQLALLVSSDSKDWTIKFPIESLKELYGGSNLKTRLGDLDTRINLKKTCLKNLEELDSLDNLIKISLLELMIEKINFTVDAQN
jgi:hypothetical protein